MQDFLYPEEAAVVAELRREAEGRVLVQGCLSFVAHEPGKSGRVLTCGRNLVVNTGKEALAKLFGATALGYAPATIVGNATTGLDIGYLAVGDGGLSPLPTTTSLNSELTVPAPGPGVIRPTFIASLPPPGPPFTTLLATAQIGTADLNGSNIDEAAIYCFDDTTMFAARGFGAIAKTAAYALEARWTITF